MKADKIIRGRIYPADGTGSFAEAMAIRDGKILAVGSREDLLKWAGDETEIEEKPGLIIPDITEGHAHVTCASEMVFGLAVRPVEQILPAAHGEDLTGPDCHGFGKGACPVCRIDPAVNDLVRFHSGCLLRCPARTAIPASQMSTTAKIRREETTYTCVEIFPRTMP